MNDDYPPEEPEDLMPNTCHCGSGKPAHWEYDARGIPLCKVCDDCEEQQLSKFRPEVLTNSNYECDEPIDEDY